MTVQIINPSSKSALNLYRNYFSSPEILFSNPSLIRAANLSSHKVKILSELLSKKEIAFHIEHKNDDKNNLYILTHLSHFLSLFGNSNDFQFPEIISAIRNFINYDKLSYKIADKIFSFDKSYVMGILNVTPDSFSDGGLYSEKESAITHAIKMLDDGANFIDIGGESTRPGAETVSEEDEINRVIPVIEGILKLRPEAIISIDTYKANVAREALKAGAKIVNDISGGTFQPQIFDVVKEFDASLIIMHIKGTPKNMQLNPNYDNLIEEIYDFLFHQTVNAGSKGIKNIFVDPGIGFGKRIINDNLEIIERLEDFKSIGFPILIGLSRKSFIGKMLNLEVEERETGSAILEALSVKNGAKIIRTHNVKNGIQVSTLLNKINKNV